MSSVTSIRSLRVARAGAAWPSPSERATGAATVAERDDERAPVACAVALGSNRAAMHLGQRFGECEANAQPALRALERRLELAEHVEDGFQLVRRDADAAVADTDDDFAGRDPVGRSRTRFGTQLDPPIDRREFRRVVENVRYDLRQPREVGIEVNRLGGERESELLPSRLDNRQARLDCGIDDLLQCDR